MIDSHLRFSATGPPANVEMYKQISNLVPFAVYSFFVETYVLDGEVRKSGVVTMRLSEAGDITFSLLPVKVDFFFENSDGTQYVDH